MAPAFVDIHCHLLPGIDDGAADLATSLAMARMAAADGMRTIIATPHQFVATDAHGLQSRRPRMRRAYDRVVELTDETTAVDLCCCRPTPAPTRSWRRLFSRIKAA